MTKDLKEMEYYRNEHGVLYHGDCLEVMEKLKAEYNLKVDLVLCDPPYGTTACKWDSVIPFEPMWGAINGISKENAPTVLCGSEPFSSALRISNIKKYKCDWVWNKKLAGNGILAKVQPLKIHENIMIFATKKANYYPQMTKGKMRKKLTSNLKVSEINGGDGSQECKETMNDLYYPKSIIDFSAAGMRKGRLHPTQKPVALFSYLIKTYTNENELVIDFAAGSGTTAVAAQETNRKWILIEKEQKYCDVIVDRLEKLKKGD